jgi:hypothetical protein
MGNYIAFSPKLAQRLLRKKLPHIPTPEPELSVRQQRKMEGMLARSRQEKEDQELFTQLRAERAPPTVGIIPHGREIDAHVSAWRLERRIDAVLEKFTTPNIRGIVYAIQERRYTVRDHEVFEELTGSFRPKVKFVIYPEDDPRARLVYEGSQKIQTFWKNEKTATHFEPTAMEYA